MTDTAKKFYSVSKSGKFKTKISRRILVTNDQTIFNQGIQCPVSDDNTKNCNKVNKFYLLKKMIQFLSLFVYRSTLKMRSKYRCK